MIKSFQGYLGTTQQANRFKQNPLGTKTQKLIEIPTPIKQKINEDNHKPRQLPITDHIKSSMPRLIRPDLSKPTEQTE